MQHACLHSGTDTSPDAGALASYSLAYAISDRRSNSLTDTGPVARTHANSLADAGSNLGADSITDTFPVARAYTCTHFITHALAIISPNAFPNTIAEHQSHTIADARTVAEL